MRGSLARLLLGQVVGQLCLVVAIPLLTRLVAPAQMGLFQVAAAIGVVLQPAATLCHEFRIPVATSTGEVAALRRAGLRTLGGTAAMCGVVAVGALLADAGAVAATSLTTAILLLAYAGTVLDNAVLIHADRRSALAVRNLLSGVLGAGLQIGAALLVGSAVALGAAVLLGRLVAIGVTHGVSGGDRDPTAVPSVRSSLTAVGAQSIWVLSMQTLTLLSTPFFAVLAVPFALQITTGPLVPLLIMLDRQTTLLRLQIARSGAAILAVVGGALLTADFVATCLAYAVAETACYAACLVAILREATRWDVVHAEPGAQAPTPG